MSEQDSIRIFVPSDTTARSLGADAVADAIRAEADARGQSVEVVRNGSRGLYWLEPMVEVAVDGERHAYGPIEPGDVPGLFDAGFQDGGEHAKSLGATEAIPYLAQQSRLTMERVGIVDPLSLEDYRAHGGYRGLANALEMSCEQIVEAVTESGLRGRGGAAFPTGIKWNTVLKTEADQKYIACNADEGDSGTFADSHGHGVRSVRTYRGHDDSRSRCRRHAGLHLYPCGVSAGDSDHGGCDCER